MNLKYVVNELCYEIPYEAMNVKIVRFTYLETDAGLFSPKHIHNAYEFHYVKSGKGIVNIDGNEFEVSAGHIYLTKPFINHSEYSCPEDPLVLYCFECTIDFNSDRANMIEKYEIESMKKAVNEVYKFSFIDDKGIINKLDKINGMIVEGSACYRMHSKVFILDVIVSTIEILLKGNSINYPKYKENINDRRVAIIKSFVEANIQNNITVSDVSKIMFFSPKQINRILIKEFNQTFSQYVISLRIGHVKERLKKTNDDVADIARQSGFDNYLQMYRHFVSAEKISPTEYRKKYTEKAACN